MSLKRSIRGATLLELVVAIALGIVVVVVITLTFPKTSLTISNNRQKMFANNFANTRLQELQSHVYQYLPVTSQADLGGDPNCDCSAVNIMTLPVDPNGMDVDSGITYTRRSCVHLVEKVGATWNSFCPDNPLTPAKDKGLKHIRINVSWRSGNTDYSTEIEGLVAR
jgi:type II secretory pathway pseudopilin PulG